jgi:hypothetical protein
MIGQSTISDSNDPIPSLINLVGTNNATIALTQTDKQYPQLNNPFMYHLIVMNRECSDGISLARIALNSSDSTSISTTASINIMAATHIAIYLAIKSFSGSYILDLSISFGRFVFWL